MHKHVDLPAPKLSENIQLKYDITVSWSDLINNHFNSLIYSSACLSEMISCHFFLLNVLQWLKWTQGGAMVMTEISDQAWHSADNKGRCVCCGNWETNANHLFKVWSRSSCHRSANASSPPVRMLQRQPWRQKKDYIKPPQFIFC